MINPRRYTVLVDEGKRGAGDLLRASGPQSLGNAFSESRFPRTQVADQQNGGAARKLGGEDPAESDGFFFRRRPVYGHTTPWLWEDKATDRWQSSTSPPVQRHRAGRRIRADRQPRQWLARHHWETGRGTRR